MVRLLRQGLGHLLRPFRHRLVGGGAARFLAGQQAPLQVGHHIAGFAVAGVVEIQLLAGVAQGGEAPGPRGCPRVGAAAQHQKHVFHLGQGAQQLIHKQPRLVGLIQSVEHQHPLLLRI